MTVLSLGRPHGLPGVAWSCSQHCTIIRNATGSPNPAWRGWRGIPATLKRPNAPRAPADGLSDPIGEVGRDEKAHAPPTATCRRRPSLSRQGPTPTPEQRQAMSASKSPADIHLDVAPTPKGQAAAPPALPQHRPLWRSLPTSSRALLALGAGSALAAGVFAATQFSQASLCMDNQ